jgi:hypothetical protein
MRARHLLIASALAVSVPVVLAGSASAGRPDVARPEPAEYPITITECGFDIELTGVGKTGAIFFADGRAHFFSPGLRGVLTNTANGKRLALVSTGSFHDQPAVEGRPGYVFEVPTTGVGHNLLFGEFVDADGVVTTGVKAVVGRFTTTLGFLDVDPGNFRFLDLDTSAARVVDVCAALG